MKDKIKQHLQLAVNIIGFTFILTLGATNITLNNMVQEVTATNTKLTDQITFLTTSKQLLTNEVIVLTKTNKHLKTKSGTTKRNIKAAQRYQQAGYIEALVKMEKKYNMPSGILQNIAYHESRYNPNAISHKGAIGIMQIHPRWHKKVNPYNPFESIRYGAKYLNSLYKRFNNWEMALAAWNWGQGNLNKYSFYKAPRETRTFIKNVMKGIKI